MMVNYSANRGVLSWKQYGNPVPSFFKIKRKVKRLIVGWI